jgi:hypothetical protein
MIKATMQTNEGKNIVLLGLSKENLERLKEGKPIHINGSELGIANDILIMYGETEAHIYKELQPMIGENTRVAPMKPQTIQ